MRWSSSSIESEGFSVVPTNSNATSISLTSPVTTSTRPTGISTSSSSDVGAKDWRSVYWCVRTTSAKMTEPIDSGTTIASTATMATTVRMPVRALLLTFSGRKAVAGSTRTSCFPGRPPAGRWVCGGPL